MLRTRAVTVTVEEMLIKLIFFGQFIYRIAVILDTSRACVPTKRRKTMVLRRARLLLVAD